MKKALCTIFAAAVLLCGCGDGSNGQNNGISAGNSASAEAVSFVGKWQTKEVKINGMTSNSDFEKDTGLSVASAFQMEINDDGTGTVKKVRELKEDSIEWKEESGKLMIKPTGSDDKNYITFSPEGGALSATENIHVSYGIYSSSSSWINSIVCEKVDSFYNTTDTRRYALSSAGKTLFATISGSLSDLKDQGKYIDISTGWNRFDLKHDAAATDLQKSIASALEYEGFTEGVVEFYVDRDIYSCKNVKITDASGITGEFDTEEFAKALGLRNNY
ncbi:hypothetical protein SAMN02910317_01410 [Ruminococcaceae bacterium FB2012]|nr:hypothetical protein SAMN02910317_01410 [Ruminococcaceae bacterium FB2012]